MGKEAAPVELLEAAIESLRTTGAPGTPGSPVELAVGNLKAVQKTHDDPIDVYRSMSEFQVVAEAVRDDKRLLTYADGTRLKTRDGKRFYDQMQLGNCHDGQMKLTLGLLEFVRDAVDYYESRAPRPVPRMHLVYVGASSVAAHAALLAFPDMRQTIFDPAPNMMDLMPKAYRDKTTVRKTFDGMNREEQLSAFDAYFDDDTPALMIKKRLRADELILYVSDIRIDALTERGVATDMVRQQKWAVDLKCDWYMFKFRPPYSTRDATADGISAEYYTPPGEEHVPDHMYYLLGSLMLQPYAPVGSGELRLIGQRFKNKPFRYVHYSLGRIEDLTFAHNHFWRGNAMFRLKTGELVSAFDVAAEKAIVGNLPEGAREAVSRFITETRSKGGKRTFAECLSNSKERNDPKVGELGRLILRGRASAHDGGAPSSPGVYFSIAVLFAVTIASSLVPR